MGRMYVLKQGPADQKEMIREVIPPDGCLKDGQIADFRPLAPIINPDRPIMVELVRVILDTRTAAQGFLLVDEMGHMTGGYKSNIIATALYGNATRMRPPTEGLSIDRGWVCNWDDLVIAFEAGEDELSGAIRFEALPSAGNWIANGGHVIVGPAVVWTGEVS